MRILFISHYFPPEVNAPANRTYEHCRKWVADGHEVTVITGVPNHPGGVIFEGYQNSWRQNEMIDGISVLRTWMFLTENSGFTKRTLNYILFAITATLCSFGVKKPDLVVATTPQFFCGLAGAIIARLKRTPFVLEVRDLWPKSIVELSQIRDGFILRGLEWLEGWLYRSATGIVVNTPAFIDHLTQQGYPRDQIELIYNGIDANYFSPRGPSRNLQERYNLGDRFTVAYIGTLGLAQGLGTVLEAADQLRNNQDLVFLIIGDGADRSKLELQIQEKKLENVRLLGLQPRKDMPKWIATADLLLVCLRDLPVFETVIPSKIFEFLAQEKPVVIAARGEFRRMCEEADVAMAIDPEDSEALAQAIERILEAPEEAEARARRGRTWVTNNFAREDLAAKMERFMENILKRPR